MRMLLVVGLVCFAIVFAMSVFMASDVEAGQTTEVAEIKTGLGSEVPIPAGILCETDMNLDSFETSAERNETVYGLASVRNRTSDHDMSTGCRIATGHQDNEPRPVSRGELLSFSLMRSKT